MTDYNALTDDAFRAELRAFFEANYPRHLRFLPRRMRWHECRDWYLALSKKGWLAPHWPPEHGGMGLTPGKLIIYFEETERAGIGRMPDQGLTMVGPTIIRFGNDAQRRKFLPPIIAGEHIWCQGYSEPNAGSDLASLQTSAVLEGDEFVINGSKIWTSMAHDATHIYVLVRTARQAKKQEGISFVLVDMKTPGITVRPIRNIAGHEEFCQVFFDNVRTPRANLVGELNAGWTIAKGLLGFERLNIGSPRRPLQALEQIEVLARARQLGDNPAFVERLTELKLDLADLGSLYARYVDKVRRGEALGPDVSMLKIWATETYQRLSELLIEAAGEYGAFEGEIPVGDASVDILSPFYTSRPGTIYGGSNEIQRNILAKYVLKLPG
ncbi:MAG: acyl-CoA dehydrogenase [Betaproteobacteria bacterium RIFCSPLOWO2_02_64_14]|nr:MAG: acyl-CoA dehydrogenase [Betaproteobacteria bacterium RIFCSPLOWO2_02_64_14]